MPTSKKMKQIACEAILDVLTNGPDATVDEMKDQAYELIVEEFWDDDSIDTGEIGDAVDHVLYMSVHNYACSLNKKRKPARKSKKSIRNRR